MHRIPVEYTHSVFKSNKIFLFDMEVGEKNQNIQWVIPGSRYLAISSVQKLLKFLPLFLCGNCVNCLNKGIFKSL